MKKQGVSVVATFFMMSSQLVHAALNCPPECVNLQEHIQELESSIQRLNRINSTNQEYLSSLDPDQDVQRMKALSNVHIANKRIGEIEGQKQGLEKKKNNQKCEVCSKQSDGDPGK